MAPTIWASCLVFGLALVPASGSVAPRRVGIAERLSAQEAIERFYHDHRNGAKRSFEIAVPVNLVERKVRTYLLQSAALEKRWGRPVTAEMLRRETERIVRHGRMPTRLEQLFTALGDDSVRIQECLARPVVVDRLIRSIHANSGGGQSYEDWWAGIKTGLDFGAVTSVAGSMTLPSFPESPGLGGDHWVPTAEVPMRRTLHSTVWTGSEMIVWGGFYQTTNSVIPLEDGGRYDPLLDVWIPISRENPPEARSNHTAVWTGSEMIVWGGCTTKSCINFDSLRSGGRYDPVADRWGAVSLDGAPGERLHHTAVWTGDEMIIWGGCPQIFNDQCLTTTDSDAGRYDPDTDSWEPVSFFNAPASSFMHTAVWTGEEMIVWGGQTTAVGTPTILDEGGRYDPATNSWTSISTTAVPLARKAHTTVWTGDEMIVWGGCEDQSCDNALQTGGGYDVASDSWRSVTLTDAPPPRVFHSASWSGEEMIVWGGCEDPECLPALDSGARYDPAADQWSPTASALAPEHRGNHGAVWTGDELIVWGGNRFLAFGGGNTFDTGGRYRPAGDDWAPTATELAPDPLSGQTGVWTGTELIVWPGRGDSQGRRGGRYDPLLNRWSETSVPNAPTFRSTHTAIWTGDEMIVWGGIDEPSGTGVRYDPVTDAWAATSTSNAPRGRQGHTAVWSGAEMIVWGGCEFIYSGGGSCEGPLTTGGRYDSSTDAWQPLPLPNLAGRFRHAAVWTGTEMIVWGGHPGSAEAPKLGNGGRYDRLADSWLPILAPGAPSGRQDHTAVWTGTEMIVWGGGTDNSGARYDPSANSWTATNTLDGPSARSAHSAIWTGEEMIIWGGIQAVEEGARYDPESNGWSPMSTENAPLDRAGHVAVWTGEEMIVWGGISNPEPLLHSGGRYRPPCDLLAFGQKIVGQDPGTIAWPSPVNAVYVRGPLASVSSYSYFDVGTVAGATELDVSLDSPAPGAGNYYLLRLPGCGSYQTAEGAEPARDAGLP